MERKNDQLCTVLLIALVVWLGTIPYMSSSERQKVNTSSTKASQRYVAPQGQDSNNGSRTRPWRTIQHAAQKATPGTTVHVAPGTYPEAIVTSVSGTPGGRIRFVSDVKWGAAIRTTGAYRSWTNEASYVDITGFDISGDGYIGLMNLGSNVRIVANHVHDVPARGCTGDGGAGIDNGNYSASDNDIIGNVVHDIGDYRQFCIRVQGIYHSNRGGNIINNLSYRNQSYGIHLWHAATHVTIANNLVFNNYYGGILVGAGDSPGGVVNDYTVVANNIVVFNQKRHGIEEYGATGAHNLYTNNLVYGNQWTDWSLQHGRQAAGTIKENPQFVDYRPDGSGNYCLRPNSPARGAGNSVNLAIDIDGRARPQAAWDLGPYQCDAEVTHPYPHVE